MCDVMKHEIEVLIERVIQSEIDSQSSLTLLYLIFFQFWQVLGLYKFEGLKTIGEIQKLIYAF